MAILDVNWGDGTTDRLIQPIGAIYDPDSGTWTTSIEEGINDYAALIGEHCSHTYASAGAYTVTVTVAWHGGVNLEIVDSATFIVDVSGAFPLTMTARPLSATYSLD